MTDSKPTDQPELAEKITAIKKTKDPKRVEAGKKLAAISKAAKEKKMRKMIEMEKSLNNEGNGKTGFILTAAVIFVIGFLSLKILTDKSKQFPDHSDSGKIEEKKQTLENL